MSTMTATRVCGRGCMVQGRHVESHSVQDRCRGCLPVEAEFRSYLCPRCLQRLRHMLEEVPDLCAHLRTLMDPLKAQHFSDKLSTLRAPHAPAPVNVDLIDALQEIMGMLAWWANYLGDRSIYRIIDGVKAGITPEEAYGVAKFAVDYLTINMQRLANDPLVVLFSRKILDWPDDEEDWTVRKALARFPLTERSFWSPLSCPKCRVKSVRVTPAQRKGGQRNYQCRSCGWIPPINEQRVWATYFEGTQ